MTTQPLNDPDWVILGFSKDDRFMVAVSDRLDEAEIKAMYQSEEVEWPSLGFGEPDRLTHFVISAKTEKAVDARPLLWMFYGDSYEEALRRCMASWNPSPAPAPVEIGRKRLVALVIEDGDPNEERFRWSFDISTYGHDPSIALVVLRVGESPCGVSYAGVMLGITAGKVEPDEERARWWDEKVIVRVEREPLWPTPDNPWRAVS